MKRLTISMSDDLFDSLSKIQNKSLFVRKLIEQGLDAGFGGGGKLRLQEIWMLSGMKLGD